MTPEERAREICEAALYAFHNAQRPETLEQTILRHLREVEAEAVNKVFDNNNQKPEPQQWVKCSERMPTMEDSDDAGQIWLTNGDEVEARHWAEELPDGATHWMPTGLVRPEPPKETTK